MVSELRFCKFKAQLNLATLAVTFGESLPLVSPLGPPVVLPVHEVSVHTHHQTCAKLFFSFFSRFNADLMVSFWSSSCCMTRFWPNFSNKPSSCLSILCYMKRTWSAQWPRGTQSCDCKRTPDYHPPLSCLKVGMTCFCCVWCSPNMAAEPATAAGGL